jgi:predicted P-loop ATPase
MTKKQSNAMSKTQNNISAQEYPVEGLELWQSHIDYFASEGITPEDLLEWSSHQLPRSVTAEECESLKVFPHRLTKTGRRVKKTAFCSGILMPAGASKFQFRPDEPRESKYYHVAGVTSEAWYPNNDRNVPYLTEGYKDAIAYCKMGIPCGSIAGVYNVSCLEDGSGKTIIFDADARTNSMVINGLARVSKKLKGKVILPPELEGEPKAGGVEYLKAGIKPDLESAMDSSELVLSMPAVWAELPNESESDKAKLKKLAHWFCKMAAFYADEARAKVERDRLVAMGVITQEDADRLVDEGLNDIKDRVEEEKQRLKAQQNQIERSEKPSDFQLAYYRVEKALKGRVRLNLMTKLIEVDGQPLVDVCPKIFLQIREGIPLDISKDDHKEILLELAGEYSYNPLVEYLDRVYKEALESHSENGLRQLATQWATELLGASSATDNMLLQKTLISAVARAKIPGCKVDTILVLYGKQGIRKSTFWDVMGGEFYGCGWTGGKDRDDMLKPHQKWIFEWDELSSLGKRETEGVKSMLSRASDIFRHPYGTTTKEHRRRFILTGSTNNSQFLTDSTGNRRWWVLHCKQQINIDKVRQMRDLIWASIYQCWADGESWWLESEQSELVERSMSDFMEKDVWEDAIVNYLEAKRQESSEVGKTTGTRVNMNEILDEVLQVPIAHSNSREGRRVKGILERLGYSCEKEAVSEYFYYSLSRKKKIEMGRVRVWSDTQFNPNCVSNCDRTVIPSSSEPQPFIHSSTVQNKKYNSISANKGVVEVGIRDRDIGVMENQNELWNCDQMTETQSSVGSQFDHSSHTVQPELCVKTVVFEGKRYRVIPNEAVKVNDFAIIDPQHRSENTDNVVQVEELLESGSIEVRGLKNKFVEYFDLAAATLVEPEGET